MLATLRQLFGYLILATLLVNPIQVYFLVYLYESPLYLAINPVAIYYLLCAIGAYFGNQYCKRQWFALDVLAATTLHGTFRRTISGITGQHMDSKKRYMYQAKVIDWLAIKFGDAPNHCYRAYLYEKHLKFID